MKLKNNLQTERFIEINYSHKHHFQHYHHAWWNFDNTLFYVLSREMLYIF